MVRDYKVRKIEDDAYMVEVHDEYGYCSYPSQALARALPDLDIFQATVIADALNKNDSRAGDDLIAIIDEKFHGWEVTNANG